MVSQPPPPTEVEIINSLSHPLAVWLREVLDGSKKDARLIVIDDEENILQARRAGLKLSFSKLQFIHNEVWQAKANISG